MKPIDISIIIVNYKTPKLTHQAIRSAYTCPSPLSIEIILVDNASKDGSIESIRNKWGNNIRIIENRQNLGFARANNLAMKVARGRYYFLLNSDAQIIGDTLQAMVKYTDEHPRIGIMGCKIISDNGQQQQSCWRSYTLSYLACRAFNLYRWIPDGWLGSTNIESYGKPQSTRTVKVVSGCAMLVRREAADQVGLFDERFFMYCEDMDLCTRIRENGFEIVFYHGAMVLHHGGGTSASMFQKMAIEQSRSMLQYFRKRYSTIYQFIANIFLGMYFGIRLPYWCLKCVSRKSRKLGERKVKTYARAFLWHIKWPFFRDCSNKTEYF